MTHKKWFNLLAILMVASMLLAACGPQATPEPTAVPPTAVPPTAVPIGTADNPIKVLFVPSVDAGVITAGGEIMANALKEATGLEFEVSIPTSYAATIEEMCASPDNTMAFIPAQGYVLASQLCGVDVAFKAVRRGWGVYWTMFVVQRDSSYQTLADLDGKKWAYPDAGSTSGYLLPRIALEDAGLQLSQLPDPRNPVPRGTLGYSFAQGEVNVIAWVNRGLADAGALSNLDWTEADPAIAPLKNDLHVIHKTRPVIRSLFLARQSLDDRICDRIAEILFAMHETPEGNEVLRKYFKVARFDSLEGDAGKGLEEARKAWLRLRGQTQ